MAPTLNIGLIWRLLGLHLALRLLLAWWLPLGVDEAYAIAAAREFSWSFFDHPPMGFWLGVVLAKVTGLETALVYRLPFVLLGSVTAWAVWQMGRLWSERAGLIALILFLIAPHMVFGSGLFVLPDAPLNAGAALAVFFVLRMVMDRQSSIGQWALAGSSLALAMASKYQGGVLALAVLLYLITSARHRHWLAAPGPWVGAATGLIGLVPVLVWNVQQDWVSLAFHGGRTGGGVNLPNLVRMLAGQAVYLLPPVMVLSGLALYRLRGDEGVRLLQWVALLPILFFNLTYLFGRDTLPHWTMSGWLFAFVLAGVWLDSNADRIKVWRAWIVSFAVPIWALVAVFAVHLPTGLLSADPAPEWDRQVEIIDLSRLAPQLEAQGWLDGIAAIAVQNWRVGGQVSTALGGRYPVRVLGADARHFQFHTQAKGDLLLVLLDHAAVIGSDAGPDEAADLAARAGLTITTQGHVVLDRGGVPQIKLRLYRLNADQ
jgi:4-amino-4-deoxy-L-arabinose transferase-like glycosyltransferase